MKTALILTITLCAGLLFAQNEKKSDSKVVDSKVVSATVFKNRALVIREAQIELPKGKHKLIFSNLPVDLLDETVRVSAGGLQGSVKILDVKVEQRFTAETQQKTIKDLENQIDSLNQLVLICLDKIAVYTSKKEFVESLKAQSSKYINEKMLLNLNNTKEWNDMLSYVDNNLSEIYKGMREQTRRKSLLEQKINAIKSEMNQSQGKKSKNFKEVIVNVETANRGQVKLFPSYLVQNAGWYPLYDARVISESKQIELHYFGMLQQSTGEDWNDVALTLSTAEPLSVKSLPGMDRWFIDTKPLPVKQSYGFNKGSVNSDYHLNYERNWGLPSGTGAVSGYLIDNLSGEALKGVSVTLDGTSLGSVTDENGKFFIPNVPSMQYSLTAHMVGFQTARVSLRINEKNTANLTIPLSEASIQSSEVVVLSDKPAVMMDQAASVRLRGGRNDAIAYSLNGASAPKEEDEQYTNVFAKELSTTFEIPANNSIPSDNTSHKVTIAIKRSPVEFTYTSMPRVASGVYLKGKMANKENYPLLEGEINIFVDNDFINRTYLNTIVPTDTLELALGIDERMQVKKVLLNKFQESKGLLGGKKQITYDYEIQIENNRTTEESVLIYDQIPIAMNEDIRIDLLEPKKEKNELGSDHKLVWNLKLKPGEKKVIPVKYQVAYPNNLSVFGLE